MPFPLICFILKNLDFNLSQFMQFPISYGLLFLVIFPLIFLLLSFFYMINNKFPLYIIIYIISFFKKSFLFLISYKIKNTQNIPHKLLEMSWIL